MRDSVGKKNVPLDEFLALNAMQIGIVPPEVYLDMLGWEIVVGSANEIVLRRAPDFEIASLNPEVLQINMSVSDILNHCIACGFVAPSAIDTTNIGQESCMGMTSMSLPHDKVDKYATTNTHTGTMNYGQQMHGVAANGPVIATTPNVFTTNVGDTAFGHVAASQHNGKNQRNSE